MPVVTEIELNAADKKRLCNSLELALSLCEDKDDLVKWINESQEQRNKLDGVFTEYLRQEYETKIKIINITKDENYDRSINESR